jgi:hypothetical protein
MAHSALALALLEQTSGLKISREWLTAAFPDMARSLPAAAPPGAPGPPPPLPPPPPTSASASSVTSDRLAETVFSRVLTSDLRLCALGCLPRDVSRLHKQVLPGPYLLQIDEVVNIGACADDRAASASSSAAASGDGGGGGTGGSRRCLKLSMTDGVTAAFALEYRTIPDLSEESYAGIKVLVKNVEVRRGMLLLAPDCVFVLGGRCDRLVGLQQAVAAAGAAAAAAGPAGAGGGAAAPPRPAQGVIGAVAAPAAAVAPAPAPVPASAPAPAPLPRPASQAPLPLPQPVIIVTSPSPAPAPASAPAPAPPPAPAVLDLTDDEDEEDDSAVAAAAGGDAVLAAGSPAPVSSSAPAPAPASAAPAPMDAESATSSTPAPAPALASASSPSPLAPPTPHPVVISLAELRTRLESTASPPPPPSPSPSPAFHVPCVIGLLLGFSYTGGRYSLSAFLTHPDYCANVIVEQLGRDAGADPAHIARKLDPSMGVWTECAEDCVRTLLDNRPPAEVEAVMSSKEKSEEAREGRKRVRHLVGEMEGKLYEAHGPAVVVLVPGAAGRRAAGSAAAAAMDVEGGAGDGGGLHAVLQSIGGM